MGRGPGVRVDLFDFTLPPERIAQHPASPRDSARLLEVGPALADHAVRDLPRLLRPGDLLVVNDTRVIRARLRGRRGNAGVEVTLHKRVDDETWAVFARPAKKLRPGDRVDFAEGFAATVLDRGEGGEATLRFSAAGGALLAALERHGEMPLPPYIRRGAGGDAADAQDYQTLWAAQDGAVAAPTAGLHFTPALMASLAAAGIGVAQVTLHVGAGTFLPVKAEDTAGHHMHAEIVHLGAATVERIAAARAGGGRVVAIGTTVARVLESAVDAAGELRPFDGETRLFITPGFRFRAVDLMLTNFHLPRSTLFMLVSAFAGLERMQAAYAHAIAAGYRFYSYGDACLLHAERPRG